MRRLHGEAILDYHQRADVTMEQLTTMFEDWMEQNMPQGDVEYSARNLPRVDWDRVAC
jgi:hypothetical protein